MEQNVNNKHLIKSLNNIYMQLLLYDHCIEGSLYYISFSNEVSVLPCDGSKRNIFCRILVQTLLCILIFSLVIWSYQCTCLILNRPPFETLRFVGELLMGFLFGLLIKVAVPEDLLGGHDSPNLKYLDLIVPYAVATGIFGSDETSAFR